MKKLTPAQLHMLENVRAGRTATFGLTGRSAMGGASGTWCSLHRLGLLVKGAITDKGREVLGGDK